MKKTISINELTDRFHIREAMDDATVQSYREGIAELPAILVWRAKAEEEWVVLDGRHRTEARRQEGMPDVEAIVFEGSEREAQAKAWTANLRHGLPLSKAEKRRARIAVVRLLYNHTDNWIATELACSPHTVLSIREELESRGEIPAVEQVERKGGGMMTRNPSDDSEPEDKPEDGGMDDDNEETPDWLGGHSEVVSSPQSGNDSSGSSSSSRHDEPDEPPNVPKPAGKKPKTGDTEEKQRPAAEASLRFAQASDPITATVVVYVNDKPCDVPVTIMFARGSAVSGIQVEPDFRNILVIGEDIGKSLRLLWEE